MNTGYHGSEELVRELINMVRTAIEPIAKPETVQFVAVLPKTRSGKIMRKILRKIVERRFDEIYGITSLSDPTVVEGIVEGVKKKIL